MNLQKLTSLLSALSHETRAKVFFCIYESPEPLYSSAIAAILDLKEALVSHHLGILVSNELVFRHQAGKYAMFVVNPRTLLTIAEFFFNLSGGRGEEKVTTEPPKQEIV